MVRILLISDYGYAALSVFQRKLYGANSKEVEEGVVIDFSEDGYIVGIEILEASRRFKRSELVNVSIENLPLEIADTNPHLSA